MRKALVGVPMAAVLVLPLAPSTASAATTTTFSEFGADRALIDVEHRVVTFSGRLVTTTGDAVAGVPVRIHRGGTVLATATTGADGRFSVPVTLAAGNSYDARFMGNAAYDRATAASVKVGAQAAPARISLDPLPSRVVAGTNVTFSGLLEWQVADQTWKPGARTRVWLIECHAVPCTSRSTPVTTDDTGRFRISLPQYAWGEWWAQTSGPSLNEPLQTAYSAEQAISMTYPTAIQSFDVTPEPAALGGYANYRLKVLHKAKKWEPSPQGQQVQIFFRPKGSKIWKLVARTNVGAGGSSQSRVKVTGDGDWQARVPKDVSTLPSVSGTDYVDAKYASVIRGFNASPEPVRKGRKITLSGGLAYVRPGDPLHPVLVGRRVTFYFLDAKTRKWSYAGSDVTDRNGFFGTKVTAKRDGYWRAYYAGDGTFLRSFGKDDYVDVR